MFIFQKFQIITVFRGGFLNKKKQVFVNKFDADVENLAFIKLVIIIKSG